MDRQTRHSDGTTLWLMALCYAPVAVTVAFAMWPSQSPVYQWTAPAFAMWPSQSPVYQWTAPALAVLALGLALIATTVAARAIAHDNPAAKERGARRLAICLLASAVVMTLTVATPVITAIAGI